MIIDELKTLVNPNHFIEWLDNEGEDILNTYQETVTTMCEYSCLYFSMLFKDHELSDRFRVSSCYYKLSDSLNVEHYFISYHHNNDIFIIDLTAVQFDSKYEKINIHKYVGSHDKYVDCTWGLKINDYITKVKAFDFYVNPVTMLKPDTKEYHELVNFINKPIDFSISDYGLNGNLNDFKF